MTYTPDYTIEIPDGGKIHLLFNSFTFREYCSKIGIELEALYDSVKDGTALKLKNVPDLLLTSAKSYALFNDQDIQYRAIDSERWLDDIGGIYSPVIMTLYKVFVSKLLNVPKEKLEVLMNGGQATEEAAATEVKKNRKAKA